MKTTLLKISFVLMLLIFMGAGCVKEDDEIFELQIGDKNAVIQKEVEDVEFKFCLLNEQGAPATVFNEGENFSFYFSITNNTGVLLNNDPAFIDKDIFHVFDFNNTDHGKPYELTFIWTIGKGAMPLAVGIPYTLIVPWKDNRESWNSLYRSFKGLSNDFLPKGKYSTQFSHAFSLGSIKTDELTFKINFEVK